MTTSFVFALAICGPAFTADCAPEKLVRMVTQNIIRSWKWKFTLMTREDSEKPMPAMLSENDRVIGTIRYLSYQVLESAPAGLFTPPPGISIRTLDLAPQKGTY